MYDIHNMNKKHLGKISVQTQEISQHQFSNMETVFIINVLYIARTLQMVR